jgi:peptide/nickel transport system substrate-binding protein
VFHSREFPPGRNRIFYTNPLVDKLLDQAATDTHRESRREKYFEIQALIAKDVPYISLWYPSNVAVATRRLKGLKLNTLGSWMHLLFAKKGETHDKS